MSKKIVVVELDQENRKLLSDIALSNYLGKKCVHCGRTFRTLEDLEDAVYAGDGHIACKKCWDQR